MIENVVNGYVLKNADKKELLEANYQVSNMKTYLSFEAGQAMRKENALPQVPMITKREKEILTLIAEGFTNPEIAEKLFVSSSTEDSHRKNLLAKLDVKKPQI